MIEPSEDSFETMMERKNPSSKQMESSEGSSNTAEGAAGAAQGAARDPAQEAGELPIDLLQDMEEPSSGLHREIKDPPNDLLQDLEESRDGARPEAGGPVAEGAPAEMEEAPVNAWGDPDQEDDDTDLDGWEEEEEEDDESPAAAASASAAAAGGAGQAEFMAMLRSLISVYFRMQDLREQQRVAEEILVNAISEGRLPAPGSFSGDRREYHEFIVLCQLTLQSSPATFCSDRLRVEYVIRHLSGMAREWAEGLVQERSPLVDDFPAFLEAMSEVFEYRQALRVAEDAIFTIRQGDRAAIEYIDEFRSLVPTLGWPDEVLQAHLCQGLREEIRHYLFRVPQPASLDSLFALVLQIEEKLAERRALLRLPPEARPRNLTWIDAPAPERWMVSSWLPWEADPSLERKHLFLLLLVRVDPYRSVAVQALVDSGASANFMDERFAQEHYVELYEKPYPQSIQTMDGSLIGNEPVWLHTEPLLCMHQNHQEAIEFDIVPSPNFSVILGINWLRLHAPEVDWARGRCTFHSPYCLQHCFRPPPPCVALERHAMSLLPGLPPQYSDLADVFNPKEAEDETSDQPSSDGSDDLSESEPSELQQAGDSDQNEVFYECPSSPPWEPAGAGRQDRAPPPDGSWHLQNTLTDTQDYGQIIPELFNALHGAKWFTKLQLRGTIVEESMRIHQTEDVWKAAFGLEVAEMHSYRPFLICADPVIPQSVLHFILKGMLGLSVLSYGQEVVIFSVSQEEHLQHVRQVLVRFRHHSVYCSLDGSQFHRHTVEFLGFVLTPKGAKLNKSVVATVTGYPVPGSKRSLRQLVEFILPYRHFVERFTVVAEPLLRQVLSPAPFHWGDAEQEAFEGLKRAFRKAPLLHHPRRRNPFYLETGFTRTALHAALLQVDEQTGKRVSCAFYSRTLSSIEHVYPRVERRILPIRAALMVWGGYLENTEDPVMILLNTEELASLNSDQLTVLLPGHWVFFFSHFHYNIMARPERDAGWPQPQPPPVAGHPSGGPLQAHAAPQPWQLFAVPGSPGDWLAGPGGSPCQGAPAWEEPGGQSLPQQILARLPLEQILRGLLAHLGVAQIRAVLLHFFRGLLYWKSSLATAALLVLVEVRQRLPRLRPPARPLARPPTRASLRLILDLSVLVSRGIAAAVNQLLTQMPPLVGTQAALAEGPAELMAVPPRAVRALALPPEFWAMLCQHAGIRFLPGEGPRPPRLGGRCRELHVVVGRDAVSRDALQDDLQRYRQCGLHDGLQDTSQDAQGDDVQGGDGARGRQLREARASVPAPTLRARQRALVRILALLHSHLCGAHGQPGLALQHPAAARSLAHFLAMICAEARVPARGRQPRRRARLEELPEDDEDAPDWH